DTAYVKPSYLSSIWDAPVLLTESSGRKHIQVKDEDIYDGQGRILVSRYYYKNGQLKREILENGRYRTHIGYHPNGHIDYRYTTKDLKPIGLYSNFHEDGRVDTLRTWMYDYNGKRIQKNTSHSGKD
ncbi:MAG: hypothetical protein AAFU60_11965, partial [Bacteroidota bacterium]